MPIRSLRRRVAALLSQQTGLDLRPARDFFAALASQDTAVELSGQLRTLAVALMKIANDLRWMNSGPLAGLGEIALPALQPGSSIMPGKVNPVIPEAIAMVCAQVIGNDATIAHRRPVGQLPAQRHAAGDRLQPAAEHRAAGECVARAGAQRDRGLRREQPAAGAGA